MPATRSTWPRWRCSPTPGRRPWRTTCVQTDERINLAEQELRSELVVHVSVQGGSDIGTVLAFILLLKKIERIGDQNKNILDLAEHGVSLAANPDAEAMLTERQQVSQLFADAAELLAEATPHDDALRVVRARVPTCSARRARPRSTSTSCPTARVARSFRWPIYYRYLRRIVANLHGVVRTSVEPVHQIDYRDGGTVDTDD